MTRAPRTHRPGAERPVTASLPGLGGSPWRSHARAARHGLIVAGTLVAGFAAPGSASAAVTAQFGDGALKVQGDGADDLIVVSCFTGEIRVSSTPVDDGGSPALCADVNSISAAGGPGVDGIWVYQDEFPSPSSVTLDGGDDGDSLTLIATGPGRTGQLTGGGGPDSLGGGTGPVTFDGGAGDDTIYGNGAADSLTFNGASSVVVNLGSTTAVATGPAAGSDSVYGIETVTGTAGPDTLRGSNNRDMLLGGSGADSLVGNDGMDTLGGGGGDDTLEGGDNDDSISGHGDNDSIVGGAGSDTVSGGLGTDRFSAQLLTPGFLSASATHVIGEGLDQVSEIEELSLLGSNTGDDTLDVMGFPGDVALHGRSGNDRVRIALSATGTYDLNGGTGVDTLDLTGDGVISVGSTDLVAAAGSSPHEAFDAVSLTGGTGADTLTTVITPATLSGNNGPDSLQANGAAVLNGGEGVDTLQSLPTTEAVVLNGGNGGDRVSVHRNEDLILTPTAMTGSGAPITMSSIESAAVLGGEGGHTINANAFTPGPVTLDGAGGHDTVIGSPFGDELRGSGGSDLLQGGDGFDSLYGAAGVDTLQGGDGADLLDPGTGPAAPFWETVDAGDGDDRIAFHEQTRVSVQGGSGGDTLMTATALDVLATDALVQNGTAEAALAGVDQFDLEGGSTPQLLDLTGFTRRASVSGREGDDTLRAGSGSTNDELSGGGGDDLLIGPVTDADQTVTPGLLTGAGSDTLEEIERIHLRGGDGGSRLDASAFNGAATLEGGGGNDTLLGGLGLDLLLGGEGDDQLDSRDGGVVDANDCGGGSDQLLSDEVDSKAGCELVNGAVPPPPVVSPALDPPPGNGGSPSPPSGPAGDATAPRLSLAKLPVQRVSGKALKLRVSVGCDEACTLTGSARIVVTKKKRGKKTPKPVTIKLTGLGSPVSIGAGKRRVVTFTLSAKNSRRTLTLLRQRTTQRGSLALALEASDAAGNRGTLSRSIRVLAAKRR